MVALHPTRWLLPGVLTSAASYAAVWRFYLPQLRASMPRAVAHVLSVGTAGALLSWGWGAAVFCFDASSSRPVRALGGAGCLAWLGLVNHFARFVVKGVASTKELGSEAAISDRQVEAADAIIVLGAGLTGDRPSPVLARRLDRAVQVIRRLDATASGHAAEKNFQDRGVPVARRLDTVAGGVVGQEGAQDRGVQVARRLDTVAGGVAGQEGAQDRGVLIVSGGQGADEPCSEASAMARYLLEEAQLGVPGARWVVLQEQLATSTEENVANSTRMLLDYRTQERSGKQSQTHDHSGEKCQVSEHHGEANRSWAQRGGGEIMGEEHRIIVVTSDFHVPRTRWHAQRAQRAFPEVCYQIVGAVTPVGARPAAYVREYVASVVQVWLPQLFSRIVSRSRP
ncbi:ElyC/SanA/YdcF family protein [Corynebacterium auriscanis]|uniref:YdcF family protein n=1 Tax=Corynebacterium auriscanis TaxID=99807 RepID=UPI003CF6A3F8